MSDPASIFISTINLIAIAVTTITFVWLIDTESATLKKVVSSTIIFIGTWYLGSFVNVFFPQLKPIAFTLVVCILIPSTFSVLGFPSCRRFILHILLRIANTAAGKQIGAKIVDRLTTAVADNIVQLFALLIAALLTPVLLPELLRALEFMAGKSSS